MKFQEILKNIESGEKVNQNEILPYLTLEKREDRAKANLALANSLFNSSNQENKESALVFAERAWELSNFAEPFFEFYFLLLTLTRNSQKARDALKRMGMTKTEDGDAIAAINFFNRWQYVYPQFELIDFYEYDYSVLEAISRLAENFKVKVQNSLSKSPKKKLVFIVPGITQINNVVTKENHYIIEFIDKSKFDIAVAIVEHGKNITNSQQGSAHLEKFKKNGAEIFWENGEDNAIAGLVKLAERVVEFNPDLVIASEILSDFYYYFFSLLLPEKIKTVGLSYSLPALSISPSFTHAIVSMRHPLMETPVDASYVDMETILPNRGEIDAVKKSELGIPEGATVMISSGRYNKFQNREYWKAIARLLKGMDNLYFLLIGPESKLLPELNSLEGRIREKIILSGWVDQPQRYLAIGDVYIDTYPLGGGLTIKEALALEIPVVSFEHNFLQRYTPQSVSVGNEFILHKELLIPRGDFGAFYNTVMKLVEDPDLRKRIGEIEREHIVNLSGDPKRMVKKYEDIFLSVINRERD